MLLLYYYYILMKIDERGLCKDARLQGCKVFLLRLNSQFTPTKSSFTYAGGK